jgi:hypothetical protein
VVVFHPVSLFVATTVADGTGAPVGSETVPEILAAVVCPNAHGEAASASTSVARMNNVILSFRIITGSSSDRRFAEAEEKIGNKRKRTKLTRRHVCFVIFDYFVCFVSLFYLRYRSLTY